MVTAALGIVAWLLKDETKYSMHFAPELVAALVKVANNKDQGTRTQARNAAYLLLSRCERVDDELSKIVCFAMHAMFEEVHGAVNETSSQKAWQSRRSLALSIEIVSYALQLVRVTPYSIVKCRETHASEFTKIWEDEAKLRRCLTPSSLSPLHHTPPFDFTLHHHPLLGISRTRGSLTLTLTLTLTVTWATYILES